jgi:hypothetical protein
MAFMARTGRSSASSAAFILAAFLAAGASAGAFVTTLDPQTLAEAIAIGQGRINDTRAQFHAAYHIEVGKAPVDYIEVVTPFRRIALDAEARAHSGDRLYGQRDALATLGDDPGRVDIVVELTFHPLNNFVGVPDYVVNLETTSDAPPPLPRQIARIPRFSARLAGTPLPYPYTVGAPNRNGSQPLLGGTLLATFDGPALDAQGTYWVVVSDSAKDGKELARARVDFGKLR